ncbi:MAG: hypothetical protein ACK5A1_16410 [Planctomyces sp.]
MSNAVKSMVGGGWLRFSVLDGNHESCDRRPFNREFNPPAAEGRW